MLEHLTFLAFERFFPYLFSLYGYEYERSSTLIIKIRLSLVIPFLLLFLSEYDLIRALLI